MTKQDKVELLQTRVLTDRHGADGSDEEEPKRSGVKSPSHRVFPLQHTVLDHCENDGSERSSHSRCNTETGPNSTEAGTVVPTPVGCVESSGTNTGTGDGSDNGVSGGYGPGESGGDGEPDLRVVIGKRLTK